MPARVSGVQRVVVAAAIIMAGVFAGFALVDDVTLKTIGFALTVGVIADAFLVRMTIVPAVMFLLGERIWWLPRGLDRLLPDLDVEGERLVERLDGHVRGTTATDTVGLGSAGVRGGTHEVADLEARPADRA